MLIKENNDIYFDRLRGRVVAQIDMNEELSDELLHNIIDKVIEEELQIEYVPINKRLDVHKQIFDSIRGLGVLQDLLEDEEITEIMVNDTDHIFIEKCGCVSRYNGKFSSKERLEDVIQQIVGKSNRRVNQAMPIVDTRLQDGSRVNVVLSPIAINGSTITIRKFPKDCITMDKLSQIASAVDIVVHLGRVKDKSRKVLEIVEVAGIKDGNIFVNPLFTSGHNDSEFRLYRTDNSLYKKSKLETRIL